MNTLSLMRETTALPSFRIAIISSMSLSDINSVSLLSANTSASSDLSLLVSTNAVASSNSCFLSKRDLRDSLYDFVCISPISIDFHFGKPFLQEPVQTDWIETTEGRQLAIVIGRREIWIAEDGTVTNTGTEL